MFIVLLCLSSASLRPQMKPCWTSWSSTIRTTHSLYSLQIESRLSPFNILLGGLIMTSRWSIIPTLQMPIKCKLYLKPVNGISVFHCWPAVALSSVGKTWLSIWVKWMINGCTVKGPVDRDYIERTSSSFSSWEVMSRWLIIVWDHYQTAFFLKIISIWVMVVVVHQDFREKNTEHMRPEVVSLLRSSERAFVPHLVASNPIAQFRWGILRATIRILTVFKMMGRQRAQQRTYFYLLIIFQPKPEATGNNSVNKLCADVLLWSQSVQCYVSVKMFIDLMIYTHLSCCVLTTVAIRRSSLKSLKDKRNRSSALDRLSR